MIDDALSAEAEMVKGSGSLKPNKKKSKKVLGDDASSAEAEMEKGKKVLGKGTGVLVQFIKDGFQGEETVDPSSRALLEKWSWDLLAFLDPKNSVFVTLLEKVKEILESNESRRVPKPPKVMSEKTFMCFGIYFKVIFV